MDLIIANKKRMEVAALKSSRKLDLDIGDKNDFELEITKKDSKAMNVGFGSYIFIPNTEYGGIIEDKGVSTKSKSINWLGNTWRGFLDQIIIIPPNGSPYKIVSGEANKIIKNILGDALNGLFIVDEANSGINLKSYKFKRYTSILAGIEDMLRTKNARIDISVQQGGPNEEFTINLKTVPVSDYSEEIEYSDDSKVNLHLRDYRRGINHLVCLGKGELTDRVVIHLYAALDGSISQKQYYKGLAERQAVYDYSSAETEEDLIKYGKERLRELMNYKKLDMNVGDLNLEIGDVVAGRDRESNTYLSKPVKSKILEMDGARETIEYKVEGEN